MSSVGGSAPVEVRVIGSASEVEGVVEALRCGLEVVSVRGPHAARDGAGVRVYAEVRLPGGGVDGDGNQAAVPDGLRSWAVAWPGYQPVDVTPPELCWGRGLLASVFAGRAELAESPDEVADWPARQARAVVSFERDVSGWPLNPAGRTGRTGRNLRRWGENAAADPIVVAGTGAERRVLLIRRADTGAWAIPGGHVAAGEAAIDAAARELVEETGVDLTGSAAQVLARTHVADPRETDHAWIASTVVLYRVPEPLPVSAGDDAVEAGWFPFTDLAVLEQLVDEAEAGGGLYEAHRPLLATALRRLDGEVA